MTLIWTGCRQLRLVCTIAAVMLVALASGASGQERIGLRFGGGVDPRLVAFVMTLGDDGSRQDAVSDAMNRYVESGDQIAGHLHVDVALSPRRMVGAEFNARNRWAPAGDVTVKQALGTVTLFSHDGPALFVTAGAGWQGIGKTSRQGVGLLARAGFELRKSRERIRSSGDSMGFSVGVELYGGSPDSSEFLSGRRRTVVRPHAAAFTVGVHGYGW